MKRHIIIGTAGHIDHGKTWLVKALTGTDTDRLAEEKKRGITIENGFAFLKLPDGEEAGIIDVPGHEKFIKNMLAGAGGIHIAMMVIAADEGVMPQTREHLDILSLLGIRRGVVVITKGDLEWKPGLREEIQMFVAGTFLEKAAVVVTSAVDGRGIEDLRRILWQMCLEETQGGDYAQRNASVNSFRLPIDRVFSLKGFGTIVTGTLLDGALDMDSSAMLYPKAQLVKVRGIQVHGQNVSRAFPGQRVAVNLAGIGKEEISRGEILAAADSMESTMMADVKLRLLKSGHRSLKSGARVHLYHGAAELICKVILLDREVMKTGEEAVAQLRMEQQTAMKAGDHFVIRFYSPVETIGGGVVENPNALKRKRRRKLGAERRFQTSSDTDLSKEMSGNGAKLVPAQINKTNSIETAGKNYDLNDNNINKNKENELESTPIFIKIQNLYLNSGFIPPLTDEVKSDFSREKEFSAVFFKMVRSGVLVRYDEKHYMHRDIRKKALDMAVTLYKEKGVIKTGEFRDQLGISRKCAITLLEGFDRDRITRMTNGERILITRI
ncbi:selenocysteine-specific translation elongation factor [Blautia segnis]|uniref:Selenocysteine-specific elongation factor n=1 Tax=Blautia segnis TaxID=2763030 RepID=A0A8I0DQF7_9FIRM|nr:selenocysteine-specific translation elongation factor [Blautia segnis]MBC5650720.1 selenocysteine-specific translation elongation factor [Blautia segnis]